MAVSLSNLPWYGQIGAFVVVCGAGVWGFHNYYADAELAEIEAQRTRAATLRADIDRGVNTARQLPQFRAQVADLERRLDDLKNVLPDQKDAADLVRRVDDLARQSNLKVRSISPKTSVKKTLHEEWPIEMQVEGNYHDFGAFFDRIARFPRVINVGELRMTGRESGAPTVTARYTATTFVLLDPAAAAKPAAPGAPPAGAPR